MKHCTFYSARKRRAERRLRKMEKARAAREAKREARGAVLTVSAGWVVFGGPLFGRHRVRLRCREDAPNQLYLEVDGRLTCVKTQRGAKALMMRRIAREIFMA